MNKDWLIDIYETTSRWVKLCLSGKAKGTWNEYLVQQELAHVIKKIEEMPDKIEYSHEPDPKLCKFRKLEKRDILIEMTTGQPKFAIESEE